MEALRRGEVHETARVSQASRVAPNVTIGAYSLVYDNVEIGEGTVVGPRVTLGEPTAAYYREDGYVNPPLVVGARSVIRSDSVFYAGSRLGEGFECGHHVTVREGTSLGRNCRVGTLSDIQGDCSIGEYTRLHSNVHIAQRSSLGRYVWLFPYAVLTNDPHPPSEELYGATVDDYAVVASHAVLLPGVRVGRGALVGAHSLVRDDVAPNSLVVGEPARRVGDVRLLRSRSSGDPAYPWPHRFTRGMPWESIGFEAWERANSGDLE